MTARLLASFFALLATVAAQTYRAPELAGISISTNGTTRVVRVNYRAGTHASPNVILHYDGPQRFSRTAFATSSSGVVSVVIPVLNSTSRFELQAIEFADPDGSTVYERGDPSSRSGVRGKISRVFYDANTPLPTTHDINLSIADFGQSGPRFGGSGRAVNLSTRGYVGTGDQVMIVGIIVGSGTKTFLFRGVGPGLGAFGVRDHLRAPVLELKNAEGVTMFRNEGWPLALSTSMQSVGAFPLQTGSKDAAIQATLVPGNYTLVLSSSDGGAGVVLAEAYELP